MCNIAAMWCMQKLSATCCTLLVASCMVGFNVTKANIFQNHFQQNLEATPGVHMVINVL